MHRSLDAIEDLSAGDATGPSQPAKQPAKAWQIILVVGIFVIGAAVWFFGTYHVVESAQGTRIVQKVHFTLAETFVSLDAITSQPAVTARARYPLAIRALQRDGILESDSDRDRRIDEEVKRDMERTQREIERKLGQ